MADAECRHLPRPVWHPARCERCGATLEESANARLLAVAMAILDEPCILAAYHAIRAELGAAIAEAERGGPAKEGGG